MRLLILLPLVFLAGCDLSGMAETGHGFLDGLKWVVDHGPKAVAALGVMLGAQWVMSWNVLQSWFQPRRDAADILEARIKYNEQAPDEIAALEEKRLKLIAESPPVPDLGERLVEIEKSIAVAKAEIVVYREANANDVSAFKWCVLDGAVRRGAVQIGLVLLMLDMD